MDYESVVHTIQTFITIIGFLIVIFRGGAYIGKTDQILQTLKKDFDSHRQEFTVHITHDLARLDEVKDSINEIRIQIASLGK